MKKTFTDFAIQRKRKTRITLCIRVFSLIAITSFYLISAILTSNSENDIDQGELYFRARKPLGIKQNDLINTEVSDGLIIRQDDLLPTPTSTSTKTVRTTRTSTSTSAAKSTPTSTSTSTSRSLLEKVFTKPPIVIIPSGLEENISIELNEIPKKNCNRAAILELPSDGFTRKERQQGWVVIHVLLACYFFWLLATICDDYFVPAIEAMCCTFEMDEDVAGATFMAAATSSPELFINSVGTFVTKSDIGVGTVVGSAVFNVLAVPACCGLFAGKLIYLDWWPVTRDCLMYAVAVVSLIAVLQDGKVMWYEALLLVMAYFVYISVMYWNDIMARKARTMVARLRRKSRIRPYRERTEITPLLSTTEKENGVANGKPHTNGLKNNGTTIMISNHLYPIDEDYGDYADTPWKKPYDTNFITYLLRWPITFVLWFTIPDCRKHPKLKMLTFTLCIAWIGATSYTVAMLITIVGDTINIPDSVMGLTFLAAGTSVPEAVSSVIVTNQGHGAMGISNSIGSNTFDILLCLGLPWFIKAYYFPAVEEQNWISFNSTGLNYSAISLLSTLIGLYLAFFLNRFRLDMKIGLVCTFMYIAFLIFASLIELNVFFPVNLPICEH